MASTFDIVGEVAHPRRLCASQPGEDTKRAQDAGCDGPFVGAHHPVTDFANNIKG